MRSALALSVVMTLFLCYGTEDRDSVYFEYSDYGAYDVLSMRLNFVQNDSLSCIILTGNNSKTYYEDYAKNDFGINGDISVKHKFMKYGIMLSSDYMSNSSVTRPTQSNISILPMIGYEDKGLNIRTAFGYVGKSDVISQKTGQSIVVDGTYSYNEKYDNLSVSTTFEGEDTYSDLNYGSGSVISYTKRFEEGFGNFSINGRSNISQYNFLDLQSAEYRIKRYEYDVSSEFLYIASDDIRNRSGIGFYSRNRDSYRDGEDIGYNSNSNFKISDEIFYDRDRFSGSLKLDFDTGSDKFSVDYDENDKSLSYYNFAISPHFNYRYSDYRFTLSGRYVKHEYKSLTISNLEDRDIIKLMITPEAAYSRYGFLTVIQSFPLEYYRLINISSQRSINNYIDRAIASNTDIRYDINEKLYLTGNIRFRSYYRSYDYDDTYSSSFVIKNYSASDTVSYGFSKRAGIKLSARYIYEEFGNFNYDAFTENPVNFKHHYYSSASFLYMLLKDLQLRTEYYYYEIDSYDFDQDDFTKDDLKRVYISHGPKLGMEYSKKNFYLFSGLEIENYRLSERQIKFRIESYLSFN